MRSADRVRKCRAILIQDEAQAHNIDSKNHSIKFDYCPGALRVWEFCSTIWGRPDMPGTSRNRRD